MIFLIVILGFFLRVYKLSQFGLWYDEADSILSAISPSHIIDMLTAGRVLIIHNLFVNVWKFIGIDEFTLRLSSVIFGILSVIVIYKLGVLIFDRRSALLSAFLLSISPFNIYYSQELRPYSMIVFFTLCATYYFIKGLNDKRIIYWLNYIIFITLNLYTHWVAIFFFIVYVIYFVIYHKRFRDSFKPFFISDIVIVILSLPWLWSLLSVTKLINNQNSVFYQLNLGWIPSVNWLTIFWTLKNFIVGYSGNIPNFLLPLFVYSFCFFLGILSFKDKKNILLPLLMFVLPLIFLFVISEFKSCYIDRYLIASSAFFYLVTAKGLSSLKHPYRVIILCLITFFALVNLTKQNSNFLPAKAFERRGVQCKKQDRQAAEFVLKNLSIEDGVLHVCRSTVLPFEYYFKYADKLKIALIANEHLQFLAFLSDEDDSELKLCKLSLVTGKLDDYYVYRPVSVSFKDFTRIWVIFSGWDFNLASKSGSLENKMINLININYQVVDSKVFAGINVYLYVKKDKL
ncbi:MAG: glycosyltransferase family 39 protein [Candidatus Omnitrophota bacterium]